MAGGSEGTAAPAVRDARTPVVGSLLVTRRRPSDLARTLDRVARQTVPVSLLLVVNVEADAETAQIVADRSAGWPQLCHLPIPENVGPAGAVSAGVPEVLRRCPEAEYVAFFEDDDPPPSSDALGRLIAHLEAHSQGIRLGGAGFHGAVLDRRSARLRRPDTAPTGWADVDYLAGGSCPVFLREVLEEIGGYDPRLFFGFEELEFGLRARSAGHRLHIIAHDSFQVPRRRPDSHHELGEWSWRRYYSIRNLLVIMLRHGHAGAAARVALVRGLLKPLLWLPRRPRLAATHLRYNLLATRDALLHRLGRTVDPDGLRPRHGV